MVLEAGKSKSLTLASGEALVLYLNMTGSSHGETELASFVLFSSYKATNSAMGAPSL
jgi:hypothetical protein